MDFQRQMLSMLHLQDAVIVTSETFEIRLKYCSKIVETIFCFSANISMTNSIKHISSNAGFKSYSLPSIIQN